MVEIRNVRRSPLLRAKLAQFLGKRATWSRPTVQALNEFRSAAREYKWEAFLFGGVPRGLWIYGTSGQVRDFDIVVSDQAFPDVLGVFKKDVVHRNRFGGAKLLLNNREFDIWPLSQTWAFREKLIEQASFELLPQTTFLTIDSIVIELAPKPNTIRRVFQSGFFKSVRNTRLEICLEENPFPELCALRSLWIAKTLGFTFSISLAHYIYRTLNSKSFDCLRETQLRHYKRELFDRNELLDASERIAIKLKDESLAYVRVYPSAAVQTYFWYV